MSQVAGGMNRAQQLLALPGDRHLTTRIPDRQPGPQPHPSPAGELLGGGQQQLADVVQRIWFAAPVAEGGLLHAASDLIHHRVGQLDGVEVVHDRGRMAKRDELRAGIATPWIQCHRADAAQPVMGLRSLAVDGGSGASQGHVPAMRRPGSRRSGALARPSAFQP
jgi:hypothetical protein